MEPTTPASDAVPTPPGRRYYSVAEVVALTGLGRSTLYERMDAGELAYYRPGRRRLVRDDDLDRFMEQYRRVGKPGAAGPG